MLNRRRFVAAATSTLALSHAGRAAAQAGTPGRICAGFPPGSSADNLARRSGAKARQHGHALHRREPHRSGRSLGSREHQDRGAGWPVIAGDAGRDDGALSACVQDSGIRPRQGLSGGHHARDGFRLPSPLAPWCRLASRRSPTLRKWCKANPQSASFGTSGAGTSLHFTGVMFARASNFDLTHVPYRGANLAAQDTAAGQIASCVGVLTDLLPLAQAGKMRLLGISTPVRFALRAGRADVSRSRLQGIESITLVRPVRSRTHARRSGEGIAWRDGDGVSATRSGGDPRQVRVRADDDAVGSVRGADAFRHGAMAHGCQAGRLYGNRIVTPHARIVGQS